MSTVSFLLVEIADDGYDGAGEGVVYVAAEWCACLDGLHEGDELVADAFAVELVEVTAVVGWVLVTHFEIVGLPPRGWHVDVAFCA